MTNNNQKYIEYINYKIYLFQTIMLKNLYNHLYTKNKFIEIINKRYN